MAGFGEFKVRGEEPKVEEEEEEDEEEDFHSRWRVSCSQVMDSVLTKLTMRPVRSTVRGTVVSTVAVWEPKKKGSRATLFWTSAMLPMTTAAGPAERNVI